MCNALCQCPLCKLEDNWKSHNITYNNHMLKKKMAKSSLCILGDDKIKRLMGHAYILPLVSACDLLTHDSFWGAVVTMFVLKQADTCPRFLLYCTCWKIFTLSTLATISVSGLACGSWLKAKTALHCKTEEPIRLNCFLHAMCQLSVIMHSR